MPRTPNRTRFATKRARKHRKQERQRKLAERKARARRVRGPPVSSLQSGAATGTGAGVGVGGSVLNVEDLGGGLETTCGVERAERAERERKKVEVGMMREMGEMEMGMGMGETVGEGRECAEGRKDQTIRPISPLEYPAITQFRRRFDGFISASAEMHHWLLKRRR
ncbi:hypothetical protein K402DRAFT_465896 [Aulographum hederae CBS 113979]|uniref:Uncharacterized protein n=1 Tax=Aulographum hederae CBS 113979 TaxID=1176131 RepID=A0A6G1GRX2_9PEZI|nr:hypothetical protein K402DRAFT_465896 [Aulographum hederae CBS 113979]